MPTIAPPLINGNYFDFSSVSIRVSSTKITGFKSINYTSEQAPGEVYGAATQMLGRTRGQHKASGSFELYRPEFLDLQVALQGGVGAIQTVAQGNVPGLFETNFPIIVSFAENPPLGVIGGVSPPPQTDYIIGARITKVDQSHSQGSDALTVKCDFSAMYVLYNNATPINLLLQMANVASG